MQPNALIGRQFGEFIIEERIGQGGMAVVYRANQPAMKRDVALKVITIDHELGSDFQRRFEQEAQLIAALEHLHILPVYSYGISGDHAHIAMRLLRGGTLADRLRDQPLDLAVARGLFSQIAQGLHHAHSRGVIHRDIKPSNVLLDDNGNAYLSDFGLAKLASDSLNVTKTGSVIGTPTYMSPEQLRGEALDRRTDVYSLGVLLFHALTGKVPFEATDSNLIAIIYQQLEKTPPSPRSLNPAIPLEVEAVILKAMAKAPSARYYSVLEMLNDFNSAFHVPPISSSQTLPPLTETPSILDDHTTQMDINAPTSRPSMPVTAPSATAPARLRVSRIVFIGVVVAVVAIVAAIALTGGTPAARTLATVLAGETQPYGDSVPTSAETAASMAYLGADGFIAYIPCTQETQYHAAQVREVVQFFNAAGLSSRVYNPSGDSYRQVTLIESALTDGAAAFLICPLDNTIVADTMAVIADRQLPLVQFTSRADSYGGVLLAGDDYLMGRAAGEAAGAILRDERGGMGQVVILDFPDLDIIVQRANGLEEGVRAIAPDVTIVRRVLGGTPENGERSIAQLLSEGVAFDTILSINDAGSFGAIRALEAASIDPSAILISSVDAEPLARQYITDGYYLRASVDVGRELFSRAAVNALIKLMAGSTVPETYSVPPGDVITREMVGQGG